MLKQLASDANLVRLGRSWLQHEIFGQEVAPNQQVKYESVGVKDYLEVHQGFQLSVRFMSTGCSLECFVIVSPVPPPRGMFRCLPHCNKLHERWGLAAFLVPPMHSEIVPCGPPTCPFARFAGAHSNRIFSQIHRLYSICIRALYEVRQRGEKSPPQFSFAPSPIFSPPPPVFELWHTFKLLQALLNRFETVLFCPYTTNSRHDLRDNLQGVS